MSRLRLAAAAAVTALLVAGLAPAASAGGTSAQGEYYVSSSGAEAGYSYIAGAAWLYSYDRAKDGHSSLAILKVKKNGVYTERTRVRNSSGVNSWAKTTLGPKLAKGTQAALVSCRVDMNSKNVNERYGHDCKTVYFTQR